MHRTGKYPILSVFGKKKKTNKQTNKQTKMIGMVESGVAMEGKIAYL
eukprot:COSAG05_NODE_1658_length_4325_cov_6.217700_3_plen_47_part_00